MRGTTVKEIFCHIWMTDSATGIQGESDLLHNTSVLKPLARRRVEAKVMMRIHQPRIKHDIVGGAFANRVRKGARRVVSDPSGECSLHKGIAFHQPGRISSIALLSIVGCLLNPARLVRVEICENICCVRVFAEIAGFVHNRVSRARYIRWGFKGGIFTYSMPQFGLAISTSLPIAVEIWDEKMAASERPTNQSKKNSSNGVVRAHTALARPRHTQTIRVSVVIDSTALEELRRMAWR